MKPLSCASCGGPVPLSTASGLKCPWCGAPVHFGEEWTSQLERLAEQDRLRREAEPHWARFSRAPPEGLSGFSLALLLIAPSIAGMLGASYGIAGPKVIALWILPATLPGTAGWLWAAAIDLSVSTTRRSTAARRLEKNKLGCRSCGAPLSVEPDALAASCGYCGTDSVLVDVAEGDAAVATATADLRSVTTALRRRRSLILVGIASVALLILTGSAAFGLA